LAAGDADEGLQSRLRLQDPELFSFTGQSGVIHIDGVSDEKEFDDVRVSLPAATCLHLTISLDCACLTLDVCTERHECA
jgi:hypothetical protein